KVGALLGRHCLDLLRHLRGHGGEGLDQEVLAVLDKNLARLFIRLLDAVRAKEFAVVLDFRRDGGRPAAQGQAGGDSDDGSGQVRHGSSSTAGGAGGYGAGDTLVAPLCARPGPPHSPRPHEGRGTKDVGHSTKEEKENRSAAFCPLSFERVETL